MTQLPPAGWYPDPAGTVPFRYWNGQAWCDVPPRPTLKEKRDTVTTTVCFLLAIGLAGLFGLWSLFAMMIPADGCDAVKCKEGLIATAYLLIWLGMPGGVAVGVIGVVVAAKRRRPKWTWACVSLIVVVACIAAWFVLMRIATPSSMWGAG